MAKATSATGLGPPLSAASQAIMRANRGRDTRPEQAVRSLVHGAGLRYRTTWSIGLAGRRWTRPDLAFTRARVAVYVDGCFWHGCALHRQAPKHNHSYWAWKVDLNRARDRDTDRQLRELGWVVVRAWEHEDPQVVADTVMRTVRSRVAGR